MRDNDIKKLKTQFWFRNNKQGIPQQDMNFQILCALSLGMMNIQSGSEIAPVGTQYPPQDPHWGWQIREIFQLQG